MDSENQLWGNYNTAVSNVSQKKEKVNQLLSDKNGVASYFTRLQNIESKLLLAMSIAEKDKFEDWSNKQVS